MKISTQRRGIYLVETITKEAYENRLLNIPDSLRRKMTPGVIDRNMRLCNKKMVIKRQPWKQDEALINVIDGASFYVPNNLIKSFIPEAEARKTHPEYFL